MSETVFFNSFFSDIFSNRRKNPQEIWKKKPAEKTLREDLRAINGFAAFLLSDRGGISIIDATKDDLNAYVKFLLEELGKDSKTVNREIGRIKVFYKILGLACNTSYYNSIAKFKSIPSSLSLPRLLTEREIRALLKAPNVRTLLGQRDSAILSLMYFLGLSIRELLRINIDDIRTERGELFVIDKDGFKRRMPIVKVARERCQRYIENAREEFVKASKQKALFVDPDGNPMKEKALRQLLVFYSEKTGIQPSATAKELCFAFFNQLCENSMHPVAFHEVSRYHSFRTTMNLINSLPSPLSRKQ